LILQGSSKVLDASRKKEGEIQLQINTREPRDVTLWTNKPTLPIKMMSRKAERAEINSQHVPLRQTAEAKGRGKGLEAVLGA